MMYGVFTQFTVDLDVEGAEETLLEMFDEKLPALVRMGQRILWRAFGLIPTTEIRNMLTAIDKVVNEQDIKKGFNVAGLTYYVRELTDEELINLNEISLPSQG